jgi:RNA polymerase sigma factor (sigma-70 family)
LAAASNAAIFSSLAITIDPPSAHQAAPASASLGCSAMAFACIAAPAIYKYAHRHCGNAVMADQIVGDAFEKLLEQLSQGGGPNSNLRSYLFEMAYHAMVDEIRDTRRTTSISIVESFLPAANSTEITAEEQTLLEAVFRAIRCELTEDQRRIIILRFLEDFSL